LFNTRDVSINEPGRGERSLGGIKIRTPGLIPNCGGTVHARSAETDSPMRQAHGGLDEGVGTAVADETRSPTGQTRGGLCIDWSHWTAPLFDHAWCNSERVWKFAFWPKDVRSGRSRGVRGRRIQGICRCRTTKRPGDSSRPTPKLELSNTFSVQSRAG